MFYIYSIGNQIMKPLFFILLLSAFTATAKTYSVESPDGRLHVEVGTGESLTYCISLDEDKLVQESEIAVILDDGTVYGGNAKVRKVSRRSVDEDLFSSFYKKARIENAFNEMTLKFSDFSLVVRAYDVGSAYRFISHSKHPFIVNDEKATFSFAEGSKAWIPYVSQHKETLETQLFNSFESVYAHSKLSDWDKNSLAFMPVLAALDKGRKVCIMEAELLD